MSVTAVSEARSGVPDLHAVDELYFLVERGSVFYEAMGQHSNDATVRQVCTRMAQAKRAFAASLASGRLRADSPDPYRRLGAELSPAGLDELEGIEDRLLRAVEGAVAGGESAVVRGALKAYLPQSQSCHAELRRRAGGAPNGERSLRRRGIAAWLSRKWPRE